jgi:ribosome-associated toxin RatA of RatAB toxin-antitoxin module
MNGEGQVGEQDLVLGFKFNAKGTIDCYEGDMELVPAAGARRREIAFNMIDGDFKLFQGKWSVEEVPTCPFLPYCSPAVLLWS